MIGHQILLIADIIHMQSTNGGIVELSIEDQKENPIMIIVMSNHLMCLLMLLQYQKML